MSLHCLRSLGDTALPLFGKLQVEAAVKACGAMSLRDLDAAIGDAVTDTWLVHNRPEGMLDDMFRDYHSDRNTPCFSYGACQNRAAAHGVYPDGGGHDLFFH